MKTVAYKQTGLYKNNLCIIVNEAL